MDWSANNHVALSLNNAVYLWNAGNGAISQLLELENPDEYVSSVSWIKEGNILAVGNSIGCVQVLQPVLLQRKLSDLFISIKCNNDKLTFGITCYMYVVLWVYSLSCGMLDKGK